MGAEKEHAHRLCFQDESVMFSLFLSNVLRLLFLISFTLDLPTFFSFDQYHEKTNPVRQLQRNLVERSSAFLF